jgi:decaprenyl-phosphate phosphoribosyltransferase
MVSLARPRPAHPRPGGGRLGAGLIGAARPRQWAKNVLVFAAPAAAGVLLQPGVLGRALLVFLAFGLVASGTYYLNDVMDRDADRLHPDKRHRPIAAGVVPAGLARVVGALLLAVGVGLAGAVAGWRLGLVMLTYAGLMLSYSAWLKHLAIIDLAVVASGFVLRAVAGGVGSDVPLSSWFLIVASFGSLFMVAGKRYAEFVRLGEEAAAHRPTLAHYSQPFLRYVVGMSSAICVVAYCLWALSPQTGGGLWSTLSIIPFVLGILHYALIVEHGRAGAPEDIILGDRTLQVMGAAWALLFLTGVYAR